MTWKGSREGSRKRSGELWGKLEGSLEGCGEVERDRRGGDVVCGRGIGR